MNLVLMLAAWGQENRNLLLAAGLIILIALIGSSEIRRMQRKLGIMPQYLAWLEAKTELYETALQVYAEPGYSDDGEIAVRALNRFAGQQPASYNGETTWLHHSQDTARTSATAGSNT